LKHEHGSIQVWLQKFDDVIEECETMGATISDEMKRIYLMKNINEKIFEQTLILWRGVITRKVFPDKYDNLKAYLMNEYSSQMTQEERAKVIYNVINSNKRKSEPTLNLNETGKSEKAKCFVCGKSCHKMKKCWYYNPSMTIEENKKETEKKIKEKQETKKEKSKGNEKKPESLAKLVATKDNPAEVFKGTIVPLPMSKEKAGMCLVRDALLYCEPCYMAGVSSKQVDFIYDSGTVSGVMGEKEMEILKNVEEEDVLIETVTGEHSLSQLYGDTIFGKTRILKGRSGSVLVSQYATKKMYQVINPDEDTFILKGWNHNPATKGKIWYFVRDEERYKDKLLHCTIDVSEAKCFAATNERRFYDPATVPENQTSANKNKQLKVIHIQFCHVNMRELKRILGLNFDEFKEITIEDIDHWYHEQGGIRL
jgi:Pyruvate/2-oxoacid:ferredoxin oxidoreductase delta subunit